MIILFFGCEAMNKEPSKSEYALNEILREEINYGLIQDREILDSTVNNLFFQFLFIENDTNSSLYNQVADFDMRNYDYTNSYQEYLDSLVNSSPISRNHQFNGNWIEINKFRDEYFLYIPANRGVIGKTIISDSTITDFMMDGISPNLITTSIITGERSELELLTPAHVFGKQNYIEQRKIEYLSREDDIIKISTFIDGELEYTKYYIPENRVYEYSIIVNYTDNPVMSSEFKFDYMEELKKSN